MGACRKSGNRTRIAINRTHIAIISTVGCSYSGDCVVSAAADGSVRIANLSHSPPLDTLMQRSLDYSTPGQPRHTAQPHPQSGAHGAGVVTRSMWLADFAVALSTQLPAGPPQQRPQSVSVRRPCWLCRCARQPALAVVSLSFGALLAQWAGSRRAALAWLRQQRRNARGDRSARQP